MALSVNLPASPTLGTPPNPPTASPPASSAASAVAPRPAVPATSAASAASSSAAGTPASGATPGGATARSSAASASASNSGSGSGSATASAKSAQDLAQAAERVQDYFTQANEKVTFNLDPGSGDTYVKFVNAETKQVILQIPPEEVLAMARKLQQVSESKGASGVLVDQEG